MPTEIDGFIDTDVLVRFLTGDDIEKQRHAGDLLRRIAKGEVQAGVLDVSIADLVFVLRSPSSYRLPRSEVAALVSGVLATPKLVVEHHARLLRALAIFGTENVDFGDAMAVAAAEETAGWIVYSWDHDFNRFPSIRRVEP